MVDKKVEYTIVKNRIDLLTARQPVKENQAIVRKLERKLRKLGEEIKNDI